MKSHINNYRNKGKHKWSSYWGDKVPKKFKRIFSKSERQFKKLILEK